jgi:cation:H+ antiporter
MSLLVSTVVLVVSLAVLIQAAGVFIRSAEAVGLRFGLSPFVLGVTVVALGTSLPELLSGIVSVVQGASEIAVGTAVGSNVTNILLILGCAAAVGGGLRVDHELVRVDLPFLFGSALLLWFLGYDGRVGPVEGVIALAGLAVYLAYAASTPDAPGTTVAASAANMAPRLGAPDGLRLTGRTWIALVVSAALTQAGAYGTVESAVSIAEQLMVGNAIVAATIVALGTSLPELVVSVRSAREGKPEVAVGNVIGSNIFNALGVVGMSALFGSLSVPASIAGFALPAMVGVTVLAFFVLQEHEVTRWDAWLLVVLYAGFTLQILRLG